MKNFNEVYEKIYKKHQAPLEYLRKKTRNAIIIVTIVIIIIAFMICNAVKSSVPAFIGLILIIFYISNSSNRKRYTSFFKENVIETFIKEYNDLLQYKPNMGISPSIYRQGQFESYDRYTSEDLITGTLEDGSIINMSEVHTEDESTDDKGHRSYSTVFRGLFAEILINKMVPTNLRIRKNSISIFDNNEKIEMDSNEFEKAFNVYSTDKIIAMQLLTSDIMQMILEFKEEMKLTPEITLNSKSLYIRFNTGNVFEANIMKNSLDYSTLKRYYDIIKFTLRLTEAFIKNINETEL